MATTLLKSLNDERYTVTKEFTGEPTAQFVARFEGKWIGSSPTENKAVILCIFHQDERLNGLGLLTYSEKELYTISTNMRAYGGSFMRAIGEALQRADHENSIKLINAFPEECEKYLNGWK